LVCFDMDGVLFEKTNFWMELHRRFGTSKEGEELTKKYLNTDYNRLVEEVVVKLWKGRNAKPYYDLVNSVNYLDGVKETFSHLRMKGYMTAIISASSIELARRVQKDFGVDYIFANELVIRDGRVAGEFVWPVGVGKEKKVQIIRNLCSNLNISLQEVIYVGDSDVDIEAFKIVGISIAFNSSSERLKKIATYVVDTCNLADIIKYIP